MRRLEIAWIAAFVAVMVAVQPGCKPSSDEPQKRPGPSASDAKMKAAAAKRDKPIEKVELPKPEAPKALPQVTLSDVQLESCLVRVGDPMPEAALDDLSGKRQSLRGLLGRKLTVVFFWEAENLYSVGEMEDLQEDLMKPFGEKGLAVIGVNRGDKPDAARAAAEQAGAKFPILLDPDGRYFKQVAKEGLLRTYALDAEGKILWFDVEYSRKAREDLLQTVKFVLQEP